MKVMRSFIAYFLSMAITSSSFNRVLYMEIDIYRGGYNPLVKQMHQGLNDGVISYSNIIFYCH